MIKNKLLTLGLLLLFSTVFAQKPSLTKAYNYYYEKDFANAKEAIDLCTQDAKLSTKASTWLYKGNIYFYIANEEFEKRKTDENYIFSYPDAASEAYKAFLKAKEINTNIEGSGMLTPDEGLSKIYLLLFYTAADFLNTNNFTKAKEILKEAVESYEMFNPPFYPLNGELYYYYAYTLESLNELTEAEKYYHKAINDSPNNHNAYFRLIELYKKENQLDKMKEVLEAGKKSFPNEPAFYIATIEYYFTKGEKEKATEMLKNIPQVAYQNADMLGNIANFYIQNKDYHQALDLLKKANKINTNNFVIHYNMGVCYYYLSESTFVELNKLEAEGKKDEATPLRTDYENYLHYATIYFEKVLEKEPNDLNVLKSLKSIYARTQSPKIDEINNRINQIESK